MRNILAAVICVFFVVALQAQVSTSQPALIDVTDKAALDAHAGEDIFMQGIVSRAQWSQTGAVLSIDFKGAEKSRACAAIFQRNRAKIDEAFMGDVARVLVGSKVRIHGKLEPYQGRPQIIIALGSQITILEAGPGAQPKP